MAGRRTPHTVALVVASICVASAGCAEGGAQNASVPGAQDAANALEGSGAIARLVERTPSHVPSSGSAPSFVVDAGWPKTLPNAWRLGQIGGLFVDKDDHVWVYHRPRSLTTDEAGALPPAGTDAEGRAVSALGHPRPYGPHSSCCIPAPSVLEFDREGNLIQAWGGPSDPGFLESKCKEQEGCSWPAREHGIFVDHNGFVYLGGNGQDFTGQFPWAAKFGDDSHILKFTKDGTFVWQIGRAGAGAPNSDDTNGGPNGTPQPYLPADITVDPATNLAYIADGYGNRRILIVDAETGKYVGHFGAYGQNPVLDPATSRDPYDQGPWMEDLKRGETRPKFFRTPVHCAKLSSDGLLYVCDRGNNRVQVFRTSEVGKPCDNPQGEVGKCGFVAEVPVAPRTAAGTADALNFSPDPAQSCLYVADLTNNTIYVLNRSNLHELDRIGRAGRHSGEFHWVHAVSIDTQGNLYTGEVDTGSRIQKFLRYGERTGCSGTGTAEVGVSR
jgi:DNA-binding beta-propeller fold protein YncE